MFPFFLRCDLHPVFTQLIRLNLDVVKVLYKSDIFSSWSWVVGVFAANIYPAQSPIQDWSLVPVT